MDRLTEEALCALQAQAHVHEMVLRALVASHPDPARLLAAWRDGLSRGGAGPVARYPRESEYLAEHYRAREEDWTAELVELTLPAANEPDGADAAADVIPLRGLPD